MEAQKPNKKQGAQEFKNTGKHIKTKTKPELNKSPGKVQEVDPEVGHTGANTGQGAGHAHGNGQTVQGADRAHGNGGGAGKTNQEAGHVEGSGGH